MKTISIIFSIVLIGCQNSGKDPLVLTHEQAIYESVTLKYTNSMVDEVLILDKTNGIWFQNNPISDLKDRTIRDKSGKIADFKADDELLDQLYTINQETYNINWKPIIVNGKLIPASANPPFSKVTQNTSTSYYSFSRAALSDDKTKALVKFTHHCPLCGGEWIFYLEFKDKQWIIVDAIRLWVS